MVLDRAGSDHSEKQLLPEVIGRNRMVPHDISGVLGRKRREVKDMASFRCLDREADESLNGIFRNQRLPQVDPKSRLTTFSQERVPLS